jgi:excinuclease ABC subunit C
MDSYRKDPKPQRQSLAFQDFPDGPGVYLMKDARGRILYVGKAKNLGRRVRSYFRPPGQLDAKTRHLVPKVTDVDYLCTSSEKEALLLENSLIKKHRPRYNVVLRDDKSYILFKLDKKTAFPRLSLTRKVVQDGSSYFGPFTSAQSARETLRVVNRLFPLRKCKAHQFQNRTRPCLQHQMGRCLAPCVKPVAPEEYQQLVARLELFLSGSSQELIRQLQSEMESAAAGLEFEKAAAVRDQLKAVRRTVEQQNVVLSQGGSFDLLSSVETEQGTALGFLFIRQGRVLDGKSFFWEHALDYEELMRAALLQFYTADRLIPERILLPKKLADPSVAAVLSERSGRKVRLVTARIRSEKQLLQMARTNALEKMKEQDSSRKPAQLAAALGLQEPPARIEAVDVSHLSGQGTMVGLVVFEQGRPVKQEWRVYHIPEAEGSCDDYAALAAWVRRRIASGPPWPDLLLIDGGKGQLAAVQKALAQSPLPQERAQEEPAGGRAGADACLPWELASIAKDKQGQGLIWDRIYRPNRKNPLPLKAGRPELLFLQHMRDQAHRFVLSRQQQSRKKSIQQGNLEELPGVGPRTAVLLRERFGSPQLLSRATRQELLAIPGIGPQKAKQIFEALQKKAR